MTNTKTLTTVPAQPGFFVLMPVYYKKWVHNLSQKPVVAWVVETHEQDETVRADATPVVCGGLPSDEPHTVLQSDPISPSAGGSWERWLSSASVFHLRSTYRRQFRG